MTEWENGDEVYWRGITPGGVNGNMEVNNKDVTARNANGLTPLHLATLYNNNVDVTKALINALRKVKANLNARDSIGRTPLHIAAGNNNNPEIANVLLKGGANPNARDAAGNAPLHHATTSEDVNPEVIMVLLQEPTDINAKNNNDFTPLDYFKQNQDIRAISSAVGTPAFKVYWALHDAQFD